MLYYRSKRLRAFTLKPWVLYCIIAIAISNADIEIVLLLTLNWLLFPIELYNLNIETPNILTTSVYFFTTPASSTPTSVYLPPLHHPRFTQGVSR